MTVQGEGTVSPSGDVKVIKGRSQLFTFTPKDGWKLSSVLRDGTEEIQKVQNNSYSMINITKDTDLRAVFSSVLPDSDLYEAVDRQYVKDHISDSSFLILDVRPRDYYDGLESSVEGTPGHIHNAVSVPLEVLTDQSQNGPVLDFIKDKTVLVYCNTGIDSGKAAAFLTGKGFEVKDYRAGMKEWSLDPNEEVWTKTFHLYKNEAAHIKVPVPAGKAITLSVQGYQGSLEVYSEGSFTFYPSKLGIEAGDYLIDARVQDLASAKVPVRIKENRSDQDGIFMDRDLDVNLASETEVRLDDGLFQGFKLQSVAWTSSPEGILEFSPILGDPKNEMARALKALKAGEAVIKADALLIRDDGYSNESLRRTYTLPVAVKGGSSSSGSGGGCSVGVSPALVLLLVPLAFFRK